MLSVSDEVLVEGNSREHTLRMLEDRLFTHPWQTEYHYGRFGTSYASQYRDTYDHGPTGAPRLFEEYLTRFRIGGRVDRLHSYVVTLTSGEDPSGQSADLVTTYGILPDIGVLRVSQLVAPGQDISTINPERLRSHDLYGIQDKTVQDQWDSLHAALSPGM